MLGAGLEPHSKTLHGAANFGSGTKMHNPSLLSALSAPLWNGMDETWKKLGNLAALLEAR